MQPYARAVEIGLFVASLLILVPSCGDDDPAGPNLSQAYVIRASLVIGTQTATVAVSRVNAGDPSASIAVVLLDGQAMPGSPSNTADEAAFSSQVSASAGHVYAFSVTIEGVSASGNLASPDLPCTLTITQPPPGNLTFSPNTDIDLQWDYTGSDPGSIDVFGTTFTFPPIVVFETLPASARATTVETAQWSVATQVQLQVTARLRDVLSGDLAAPNSFSTVQFATAQVQLARR